MNVTRADTAWNAFVKATAGGAAPMKRLLAFAGNAKAKEYLANQRMAAFIQFLFQSPEPVGDCAVVLHASGITYFRVGAAAGFTPGVATPMAVVDGVSKATLRCASSLSELLAAGGDAAAISVVEREVDLQQGSNFGKEVVASMPGSRVDGAVVFISNLLAVKDDAGLGETRKAAALCTATMKRFLAHELEAGAADPTTMRAEVLAEAVLGKLERPNTIPGLEAMSTAFYDWAYVKPLALTAAAATASLSQPGGGWSKLAQCEGPLGDTATVAVMYGVKHQSFTAAIGRTFFLRDPSPETKKAYEMLLALEAAIVSRLRPGALLGKVRQDALAEVRPKFGDALVNALPLEFGGVGGMLVLDPRMSLSDKGAETQLRAGMTVIVRLGLMPGDGAALTGGQPLLLCNTLHITGDDKLPAVLLTKQGQAIKELRIVPAAPVAATQKEGGRAKRGGGGDDAADDGPVVRVITTRAEKGLMPDFTAEQRRIAALKQLLREKHESWVARGKPRGGADAAAADECRIFELGRLGRGDTVAYASADAAPPAMLRLKADVALDTTRMALWLPLHGAGAPCSPVHVAAIQKCDMRSAGQHEHYFTVTFHSTQESNFAFRANRTKVFVREATFCGPDSGKFYQISNQIKELQQSIKQKDAERKAKQGVVNQTGLRISARAERLPQVKCRPPPQAAGRAGGSGCEGNLEAHENGFRFAYSGGALDILYDNVKFLIVQPSKNDIMTILHLALRSAILVNNKKTDHIQFVAEVMEGTMAVSSARRTHDEEMAIEERDAERIRKTNLQFVVYAKKVGELSGLPVEQPFSAVNFEGSQHRGIVNFRGNERVLWSVVEMPFFVLAMDTIEVVGLERVVPGNSNFDMAFLNSDYRTVTNITTVPTTELERVKDWLLHAKTIFFEATVNLAWASTLKKIRDDPDWVPYSERGGWATMMADVLGADDGSDDGDEGEGGADDDSDAYSDSDEDYESDDEEDDDDSDSDFESDSSFSDDSDSDASGGASWDSMERRAERDSSGDDSSDGRLKKKRARVEAPPKRKK